METITAVVTDANGEIIQNITFQGLDLYLAGIRSDIAFIAGFIIACIAASVFFSRFKVR
jgi:hypothetical protein